MFPDVIQAELFIKIKKSTFVSYAIEESKDIANKSQLVLSVKFKIDL